MCVSQPVYTHMSVIISLCIYPSIAKAKQLILMCQTFNWCSIFNMIHFSLPKLLICNFPLPTVKKSGFPHPPSTYFLVQSQHMCIVAELSSCSPVRNNFGNYGAGLTYGFFCS